MNHLLDLESLFIFERRKSIFLGLGKLSVSQLEVLVGSRQVFGISSDRVTLGPTK